MENFSDTNSLASKFQNELKILNFKVSTVETDKGRKLYPKEEDLFYYCLGDSYQYLKQGLNLQVAKGQLQRYRLLGFVDDRSERGPTRTSIMRGDLIKKFSNVIGVEPNGLNKLSTLKNGVNTYDTYDYVVTLDLISDFTKHCKDRWNVTYPKQLSLIQYGLSIEYRNDYRKMFKRLKYEVAKSTDTLNITGDGITNLLSAYDTYVYADGNLFNGGTRMCAPAINWAPENGRLKNEYATKGLIYCHDFFVFIGDSPGNHYLKYGNIINKQNSISYDPRLIAFESLTIHKQQLFTESDIMYVRRLAHDLSKLNKTMLIRIDIRSDKPPDYNVEYDERWEDMVHENNILTSKIINEMPDNVTIIAKLRPSYNASNVAPRVLRPCRLMPQPFCTISTAEFSLFVPRPSLNKGALRLSYSYNELISMQYQICALKRTCGKLYNMYLSDMYLNLGVIIGKSELRNSSLALYSLSNVNNVIPQFTGLSNYVVSFPYSKVDFNTVEIVSHGRRYVDNTLSFLFECNDSSPMLIPIYSMPIIAHTSYEDLTTVLLTDLELIGYSQPHNQLSTQIVKLVSFVLKQLFHDKNIDFTALDNGIRKSILTKFADKHNLNGAITDDGLRIGEFKMSVSGHMQYIILGSILGLPYGIKRYLREIEVNILEPGRSYERSLGGRVWHGFYSHLLAVDSAMALLTATQLIDEELLISLKSSMNWLKAQLTKLANKYKVYVLVNEDMKIV